MRRPFPFICVVRYPVAARTATVRAESFGLIFGPGSRIARFGSASGRSERKTQPSSSSMKYCPYSRFRRSLWLTTTTSLSSAIFFSKDIISSPFLRSRLPVGSSAKTDAPSFISALATATRCFSPPDIVDTFLSEKPAFRPAFSSKAAISSEVGSLPTACAASRRLSPADSSSASMKS